MRILIKSSNIWGSEFLDSCEFQLEFRKRWVMEFLEMITSTQWAVYDDCANIMEYA